MINREMNWEFENWDFITDETFEIIKSDFVKWLNKEAVYCRRVALDDFFTCEERINSLNEIRKDSIAKWEYLDLIKEDLRSEVENNLDEFLDDLKFLCKWIKEHGDDRNKALGEC